MAFLMVRNVPELTSNTCRYLSNVAASASTVTPRPILSRDYSGRSKSNPISCKVAIVTGGARGIGYHISDYLLQAGARAVILGDVLVDELENATCKLNSKYGENKALFQPCDVTKRAEMERMFQCTVDKFGDLDIVINNAGIAQADWEKMININVNGLVLGTLLGFQHMGCHRGGKGGYIINVASILGLQPLHSMPVYCGTKWFVIGFTRSMGSPYFQNLSNVKVMGVCPGVTNTILVADASKGKLPTFNCLGLEARKSLASLPPQPPEEVGRSVIEMLRDGENGSVWVSEGSETYKVTMPDRSTFKPGGGSGPTKNQPPKPPQEKKVPPKTAAPKGNDCAVDKGKKAPPPKVSKDPKKATSKGSECAIDKDNKAPPPKVSKDPKKATSKGSECAIDKDNKAPPPKVSKDPKKATSKGSECAIDKDNKAPPPKVSKDPKKATSKGSECAIDKDNKAPPPKVSKDPKKAISKGSDCAVDKGKKVPPPDACKEPKKATSKGNDCASDKQKIVPYPCKEPKKATTKGNACASDKQKKVPPPDACKEPKKATSKGSDCSVDKGKKVPPPDACKEPKKATSKGSDCSVDKGKKVPSPHACKEQKKATPKGDNSAIDKWIKLPPPAAWKQPKKATPKDCDLDNSCNDPRFSKNPPKKPFCKKDRKKDQKGKDEKNTENKTT